MFRSWDSDKGEIVLKWSYSGHSKKSFRAEYIKVEITSPLEGAEGAATKVTGAKPEENPEDNVVEDKDGDIFVDNVPMVDQGQKGYCLVAVMERILRYYNKDVDQHQIAQVMNSSGSRGTKISEMNKTIRSVGTQLRIRQRDIYENKLIDVDFENYDIRNFSRMLDYVKKYNRYARKGGYEKVDIDKYIVKKGGAKTYYFGDMLKAMTPEGFRYWRVNGEARDYKRAFDKMKKYIKEGIPVCWLVTLGLVEEEKLTPQARGGHARLIIGFNDKEKKVIYTDTWGGEHTFKKMPYDDAWLITNAMYALTPRD
jgi:hypothetical protein